MASRSFQQVDVFTDQPYRGNPVAVVLDAEGLSAEAMQRIALWTNLSETTFVLPPTQAGADYRVRIFTPRSELPFAGHPTLGTAHALMEAGSITPRDGKLVQECPAGLVPLAVTPLEGGRPRIAFELPTPSLAPLTRVEADELASLLGAPVMRDPIPKRVDVGPVWTIVQMAGAQAVLDLRPDFAGLAAFDRDHGSIGTVVFGAWGVDAPAAIEVRAFAPAAGVDEDPVCGSGNGAVAAFIRDAGQILQFGVRYTATQGQAVGRAGRLSIEFAGDAVIRVGGHCVTCISGTITA